MEEWNHFPERTKTIKIRLCQETLRMKPPQVTVEIFFLEMIPIAMGLMGMITPEVPFLGLVWPVTRALGWLTPTEEPTLKAGILFPWMLQTLM